MTEIVDHYLTRDDAIRFIKRNRRGRQCFLRVGAFLYTQLPDDEGNSRGYDNMCNVPVGAKTAIKCVNDLFGKAFAEKGCKIRIALATHCLFIG